MAKLKITTKFGVIPNSILNDKTLSAKAKGLWVYLQSKPNGWDFSTERIANDFSDGITSIRSGLQELEEKGFLLRKPERNNGKYNGYTYTLLDIPMQEEPSSENLRMENSMMENLYDYSNTDYSKKELSKKNKDKVYSTEVHDTYDFCVQLFDEELKPQDSKTENKWLDEIDKLNRIDKVDFEIIKSVVQKTRADSFWSKNFQSLLKLRKNDKDGIKYFTRFYNTFKPTIPQYDTMRLRELYPDA